MEAVARELGDSRVFLGREATDACLRRYSPESRLIHIATHGLFRQDNPMFSSIRLGDSQLTLFDLYQLRMSCELVVLSGCGTGLNVVLGGDELMGLVRGLLYAGARAVLVTLWDVNDQSTAEFMTLFYRHLAVCPDKGEALRAAMRDLRATGRIRIIGRLLFWSERPAPPEKFSPSPIFLRPDAFPIGLTARNVRRRQSFMFRRELALHLRILSGWDVVEIVLVASLVVSFVAEVHLY